MRKLICLTLLLSLTSCFNSESNPPLPSKSQAESNASNDDGDSQQLGPTDTPDPVNPDYIIGDDQVDYYPDADEDVNDILPGTPSNKCGVAYKQFNNPVLFFRENNSNTIYNLQQFSFDSLSFIGDFHFPNSSYNVCIEGYIDGANYYINKTSNQNAVDNPTKIHKENYTYEYCGHLAYVTNFSGITSLNLKVGAFYYLIHNKNNLNFNSIPTIQSSITSSNSIEACVYSNTASYKVLEETFKPQFDAMAIDVGALNP